MVALVNWDEEPRRHSVELAAHGAAGAFAVYDVWDEERVADVQGRRPRGYTGFPVLRDTGAQSAAPVLAETSTASQGPG